MVTLIYLAINVAYLRVLPANALAATATPASDVAGILFSSFGGKLITIGIMISVFGSQTGFVRASWRIPYALGLRDMLPFGGESITVLHTPGHTSGSCVYCLGSILFTGDTLMRFSIGRTDFPTGNLAEMRASLSRLAAFEGEYLVYPGHGGPTTLQKERENNPYLGQSNYDDIY